MWISILADGNFGYSLVSVYLTGKEIKTFAEIDESISVLMIDARLSSSKLAYTFNPNRMFLNRIEDIKFMDNDGNKKE